MNAELLKTLATNPLLCFLVMLIGTLSSMGKQLRDARRVHESEITMGQYLVQFWPETLTMVMANIAAMLGMLATDTLNVPAAWGLGYAANSLSDLIRSTKQSRSGSLAGAADKQEPPPN